MTGWKCVGCHARNEPDRDVCEGCGMARPSRAVPSPAKEPRRCWIDGGIREPDGFCQTGQGYPLGMRCPFVCPVCRYSLSWEGACFACFGTTMGRRREDWAFPGARYELEAQHWRKTDEAGRVACSVEENRAQLALLRLLNPLDAFQRAVVRRLADPSAGSAPPP